MLRFEGIIPLIQQHCSHSQIQREFFQFSQLSDSDTLLQPLSLHLIQSCVRSLGPSVVTARRRAYL